MILVNTETVPGRQLEALQLVKGSCIQTRHLGLDLLSFFKGLVGGELQNYSEMLNHSRAMATARMVEEAEALGADAVVNIRYATSAIMQNAAEVMVYGTAVRFL